MDPQGICSACSWSPTRQEECRYNSHVKLFYGVSNRGPPNFESLNIRFLTEIISIPIPKVVEEWQEDDGTCFLLTKRIQGSPLKRVAKQTAEYVTQLRELQSNQLESLGGQQLYSAFLFPNGYGIGHGPFSSDDELATPYTFTHGDFTNVNLIVNNGILSGILDWESSGYFPVWWEFTAAGISLGKDDKEWKELLRKYVPDHTEAHNLWLDFFALRKYPNVDERGIRFLKSCRLSLPNQA
ncbi:hypothetical protein BDV39DRAFT_190724 [Aspergillus sergii]|uniref:Aminoglycoside phosphotransferase domain-containing protein n=1 Tax=Aspergillus sergii TaxID=1034303 RepID=A0A5N6XA02_9EURO|nr:hypothetical protein BDV39DRAFT_190724 [Aspergillus sergii]